MSRGRFDLAYIETELRKIGGLIPEPSRIISPHTNWISSFFTRIIRPPSTH